MQENSMSRKYLIWAAVMFACGLAGAFIHRALQPPRANASQSMQAESDSLDPAAPWALGTPAAPGADDESIAEDDARSAKLLTQSGHGEAIHWLTAKAVNRGVAEWEKSEAIQLIQGFYAAGARQIDVVDPDQAGDTEIATQFIVTLPADPAARAKVFEKEAQFEAEYDEDPTPDRGQKYLHLTTD
jgi:hypothetical protein